MGLSRDGHDDPDSSSTAPLSPRVCSNRDDINDAREAVSNYALLDSSFVAQRE
jgi:hypothetical protein